MQRIRILILVLFLVMSGLFGQRAWCETAGQEGQTAVTDESSQSEEAGSWMNEESDSSFGSEGPDTGLVKRFVYVVSMVIALSAGAYYFSKKLMPKLGISQGRDVNVIETVHLGPQKMLHLIKVGNSRKLLIGSSGQSISMLADVTSDFAEKVFDVDEKD